MRSSFNRAIRSFGLSALLIVCAAPMAIAQGPDHLEHGALLFHGNFCGLGNRGPHAPAVDALDLACKHHDACTPGSGALSTCACNARLEAEASHVANDQRQPPDLQALAGLVAVGATVLQCQPTGAVIRY